MYSAEAQQEPKPKDRPTVEQLFGLARACIDLGRGERSRLGRGRNRYLRFGTDFLAPPDQTYYDFIFDNTRSSSRRFFGYIALVPHEAWMLRIKESSLVFEGDMQVDQCQVLHKFKWSEKEVIQASRIVRFVDFEEDYGESYQPESLDFEAFQPDFVNCVNQIEAFGASDCTELTNNVESFRSQLDGMLI